MDSFEQELKQGFLEEAAQMLQEAEQHFLEIESNPEAPGLIEQIFRTAHNFKGSSRAVGFDDLGLFTHELESFLLKLKNREIAITPWSVSLLLECNDHLNRWVTALRADMGSSMDSEALLAKLKAGAPIDFPTEGGASADAWTDIGTEPAPAESLPLSEPVVEAQAAAEPVEVVP